MKSTSSWLSMVLVLQIVIAGGILFSKQQGSDLQKQEPLLAFATDALDKVVISEKDSTVTLVKNAGNWQLPDYKSLPVDQKKLDEALQDLAAVKGGWPVATSSSSHERFEVDEDTFKKRVQLFNGDKQVGELYIGTSPGYRKSHVRAEGDEEVYTAELNSFEFSVKQADWLNKQILHTEDISALEAANYALKREGETWTFTGDEEEAQSSEVDTDKVTNLVNAIEKLHVQEVADVKADDAATLKVNTGSKDYTYQFITADNKYYVKRNDIDAAFVISKSQYDNIIQKSVSDLAVKTETPTKETAVTSETTSSS